MYAAASFGSMGDTAELISHWEKTNSTTCLEFYYHMYGSSVGLLKVIFENRDGKQLEIWKRGYQNSNSWVFGQVDLPQHGEFRIIFQASRGLNSKGDIAIDDVNTTPGRCTIRGKSRFLNSPQ